MTLIATGRGGVRTVVTPLHALGVAAPVVNDGPAAAANGTGALLAWTTGEQFSLNGFDVAGALVSGDGALRSAIDSIPTSSNVQAGPAIGSGGANDLVAWTEPTGLYAARITPGGASLDPHGILIAAQSNASRDVASYVTGPVRIVFDGDAYFVVWSNSNVLFGQRVDAVSGTLAGSRFTIAQCVSSFDLGRDDSGVVAFMIPCNRPMVAQRLGAAGAIGGAVTVDTATLAVANVCAAWNGSEWLVAFNDLFPVPSAALFPVFGANVYAVRVSRALATLDAVPIPIAVADQNEWRPRVAANGRDFLIVWSHSYSGIAARYVRPDASVGEIFSAVDGATPNDLIWDGARFALAYAVQRGDYTFALFLTHIAERPVGDRIVISAGPADQRNISLVAPSRAAYDRVSIEPQYGGVSRVFVRDVVNPLRRRPSL